MVDISAILGKDRMSDEDFEKERVLRQQEQSKKKKDIETEEAVRQALSQLDDKSKARLLGADDISLEALRITGRQEDPDEEIEEENAMLNGLLGRPLDSGASPLQRSPSLEMLKNLPGFAF